MEKYRIEISTFEAEASCLFQHSVEELRNLLSVEVDRLRSEYLSLVFQYISHMNSLLESSLKTAVPRTMDLLQVLRKVIERPMLDYSIEAISEGIKSRITVLADLRTLSSIAPTDFHLVFSLSSSCKASISFELKEDTASAAKRRSGHRRNATMQDWLCRNCIVLNKHWERTCRTCGYQPKHTQAEM